MDLGRKSGRKKKSLSVEKAQQIFDQTFWPHRNNIFRSAYRIIRNREEAEDLVQEVLESCYRQLLERGPDFCDSPEQYLGQSLRNRIIDYGRGAYGKRTFLPLDEEWSDAFVLQYLERPSDSVAMLEEEQLLEEFLKALDHLSEQERVCALGKVAERTCKQMASYLSIPEKTARQVLHRARRKLKGLLKPWIEQELGRGVKPKK